MIAADALRDQPALVGNRVRLEPLDARTGEHLVREFVDMDPRVRRLTGTHQRFGEEKLRQWIATRPDHHDRADWVIFAQADGEAVGECSLLDLDHHNASAGYRIALFRMEQTGHGFGTAATDLVLQYAFEQVGLHRVGLEVFEFNENARRSYARSGFREEGVLREFLYWDGEWHDAVLMSVLDREFAEFHADDPDR
ncbi:GNAT family N-acetyltransferase [Nocardiopsis salina]|uniref:GNAT family N-acetyltransferase n=1 Tax=Nocardiopsis salina TaxID=245836 RepID=UPI000346423E|nr:GNAT family protein [Nocardiopsis salina]